ncbi:MAG: SDR family NAD(P)-dependent oxidoreductase [Flavobacteriaceae bacterium]
MNAQGKFLIVGGSQGIGLELVNRLSQNNEVIVLSRTASDQWKNSNIEHHFYDVLDAMTEGPEIQGLKGLVYCPGSINLKPFTSLSMEDFKNDMELNFYGFLKVLQQYVPHIQTGGSVLGFSTVATKQGMPFHSSIAASKSAVNGLIKTLASEYASKIRFNAIAPTLTETGLAQKLLRNERMVEKMQERHPLKRICHPDEIAALAEFLLSENAAGISGQIIDVDNGILHMKL